MDDFQLQLLGAVMPNATIHPAWDSYPPQAPGAVPVVNTAASSSQDRAAQQAAPAATKQQQTIQPPGQPQDQPEDPFFAKLSAEGINEHTRDALRKHGFCCSRTFELMTDGDMDVMAISLGQRRLIQATRSGGSKVTPTEHQDVTQQLQQMLLHQQPAQPAQQTATSGELNYLLPQPRVKHLDITQFVDKNVFCVEPEDNYHPVGGSCELFVKSPKAIKLEEVSPMQYTGASLRILRELVVQGQLAENKCFQYLGYIVKIAQLAEHHSWISVLSYDRAYRQLQAQCGFAWGWDAPHLSTVHLRPRLPPRKDFPHKVTTRKSSGEKQRQPCRLYNSRQGSCPYGDKCIHAHVCSAEGCNGRHPITAHPTTTSKTEN